MPTTFFLLAGESSGDHHGARLIHSLKALDPSARFLGMGGPKMAAAGLTVAKDLEGMQVTGFWEVARHYGFFRHVFFELLDNLKQIRPDVLICIDYPGFNLPFAAEVKKLGIPVLYYIVPQVWAWKPARAKKMAKIVDRAFCVFEFEPPFFKQFGLKTAFVGHPLMDAPSDETRAEYNLQTESKTVGFLPGSRGNEISAIYPPLYDGFVKAAEDFGTLRGLFSLPEEWPKRSSGEGRRIIRVTDYGKGAARSNKDFVLQNGRAVESANADRLIQPTNLDSHSGWVPGASDFSVVKSGTSTLEAGLAGNPLCVVYRGSPISYAIAHMLVNIPVFSLVNIVLGRYAVPELLQGDVNPARIAAEIKRGLTDQRYREAQRQALAELPKRLGGPGASRRTAEAMFDFLKNGR